MLAAHRGSIRVGDVMSILDKLGKKAFDAIDSATRKAETLRLRAEPLLERTPLGERLKEHARRRGIEDVPSPERNASPFVNQPTGDASRPPLGKVDTAAQVFGRASDPWTARARQLLRDREIEHEFTDLEGEGGVELEAQLVTETKHPTGPWIYLRGDYRGGFNALHELDRLGQLEELVLPESQRGRRPGRIRVVVEKRTGDHLAPGERGNPDDRK